MFWTSGLSSIVNIKKTSDLITHNRYDQKLKSTMNLKTKSKLDFCAVRSFWLIKNLPMERFILYSNHLLSMVNNYSFSELMGKKMPFSMFLIFERMSNKGKSRHSFFPFIYYFRFDKRDILK